MLKKLFSHSVIYGLAPQASKIAGLFALPIITKDLTEADFGIWGLFLAYAGALGGLSNLGLRVVLINSFFKMPCQHKWLWRQIYGFLILWKIPFAILTGCLLYFAAPAEADLSEWILLISLFLIPLVFFGPTTVIGTYYYQLALRPFPVAIRTGVFGLISVGLTVYTISFLKLGFLGWAWSTFIVSILMNISYGYPLIFIHNMKPIFKFKWRTIKSSLNLAFPTIPHGYASYFLASSDRIVMNEMNLGVNEIGEFSLASRFGGYFNSINLATGLAIGPVILNYYKKKEDESARILIFVLALITITFTFLFSLWSKEIFDILIKNDTLKGVYPLAIIFVMSANYRPFYIAAVQKIAFNEKTSYLWRISFMAGFANVILNLIFIPIYGFEAAAYSTFFCTMLLGFGWYFVPQIKKEIIGEYYPFSWLLLFIFFTGLGLIMVEWNLSFKIPFSILFLLLSSGLILKLSKPLSWQ